LPTPAETAAARRKNDNSTGKQATATFYHTMHAYGTSVVGRNTEVLISGLRTPEASYLLERNIASPYDEGRKH
jgi:hypothetical protein